MHGIYEILKLRNGLQSDIKCHNRSVAGGLSGTHSRMRSSMILKDSVFRKEQRTHTISLERPTFLSPPCNPPQNPHSRINCMKARTRFLFPIPFPHLPQYHTYCRSHSISLNISPNIPKRKAAWNFRFSPDRQWTEGIRHPHFLRQRKLFFRPVPQGGPSGWLLVKKSSSRFA